jgi:hypothetical protein
VLFHIHVRRLGQPQNIATTSFHGGHGLPGHFVASTKAAAVISYTIGRIGAGSALVIQVGISSARRLNFLTLRKVRAVIARLTRGQSAKGQEDFLLPPLKKSCGFSMFLDNSMRLSLIKRSIYGMISGNGFTPSLGNGYSGKRAHGQGNRM